MDTKYMDEFRETHFQELWNEFYIKTGQRISSRRTEVFQLLKKQTEDFIAVILDLQKNIPVAVSNIQLSVLLTSVAAKAPAIRLEAFDQRGVVGEAFIAKEESAAWMFSEWEDFEQKLDEKVKALNWTNLITQEQIRQLKYENMAALIGGVAYMFKYEFAELDKFEGLDQILIAKPFRFSFGSYHDWQKVLYARKEEVDIFLQPDIKKLRFHQFKDAVFHNKVIEGRNFQHSIFRDCNFKDTVIKAVDFSDCLFENCIFDKVTMNKGAARGVSFRNCSISRTQIEGMDFSNGSAVINDELLDIYRQSSMINCKLSKVNISNCNMQGIVVAECNSKEITVDDTTRLEASTGTEDWRIHQ